MANGDVRVWGATNVGGFPAWSGWSSQSLRARTTMFCFHLATRLTRQSWYTSLRVIQPCLLAEKMQTFCGENVRKEKKREGIKNWRFAVCDFWAGHLVGAFYLTLPYQPGQAMGRFVWYMMSLNEIWQQYGMVWIWIWYGYGYGMAMVQAQVRWRGSFSVIVISSEKGENVWPIGEGAEMAFFFFGTFFQMQ